MVKRSHSWSRTTRFDVFDNTTGAVVARNVTSAEAGTLLGATAADVENGIANYSYLDGNGNRAAGHMQIGGT
jgi:hypothetical protein